MADGRTRAPRGERRGGGGGRGRGETAGPPSVSSVKKQLRSVQRILNKPDLPEEARAKQEAVLKELEGKLRAAKRSRLESHRATKYHKVKFFERRKCDRRIRRAEKELAGAEGSSARAAIEARLEALRADLQYIRFYPPEHKYISLYAKESQDSEFLERRRRKMRALVAKRVADAAARGVELESGDEEGDEEGDGAGGRDDEPEDDFFVAA